MRALPSMRALPAMPTTRLPDTVRWGVILALSTAVISGFAVWLNAFAVRQVPDPAVYTTLKNGVAAIILIGALTASGQGRAREPLSRGQWGRLLVIGLIGGSIPFLLFFTGLAQATAPGAAFLHKMMFIWVALLAVPLLGERLGAAQIVAMAALLGGSLLLSPPQLGGAGWGMGETMIAVATLLWSVEVIVAKRLLASVPPLVVGSARLGIGVVFLLAFLALTGSLGGIAAVSAAGWAWVLLTGVVLAGYVGTWFAALRRAPASLVTSVLVLGAVITAGLQALTNGNLPSEGVLGATVMLVGAIAVLIAAGMRSSRAAGAGAAGVHPSPAAGRPGG